MPERSLKNHDKLASINTSHEIRFCKKSEADKLQRFIHESWKANHILAKDIDLLNWQYGNEKNNTYNFIVSNNIKTEEFGAILGFIPLEHYDLGLASEGDIWLSVWMNDKNKSQSKTLGVELFFYLINTLQPASIGGLGASDSALGIYKSLNFKTGTINHYYYLNPYTTQFHIAEIKGKRVAGCSDKSPNNGYLKHLTDLKEKPLIDKNVKPHKSITYLLNRYTKHPAYEYGFYGAYFGEVLNAVIVTRKISANGSNCLRIVDVLGNLPPVSLQHDLTTILRRANAEYIDCLNYGVDPYIFQAMGFSKVSDKITIPDHFEPFQRKNAILRYTFNAEEKWKYRVFKGDGDQDRPNAT